MRVLYIDIDTLRPDHLGCYGYHRPNFTGILTRSLRKGSDMKNCYVSDAPCLPSRAALYSGKCGIRNGAINHGGEAADVYLNPDDRGFQTLRDNYTVQLRNAGLLPGKRQPIRGTAFIFLVLQWFSGNVQYR